MVPASKIFASLADPTRLRILMLLRAMELSVGEVAQVLGQSQPRVSRHVKILIDAGLAGEAADAYLAMRRRAHRAALNDEEHVRLAADELVAEREAVKRLWKAVFG